MTIVNLDEYRPHVVICTDDNVAHVIPQSIVEDWIKGISKPEGLIMRKIIEEWLRHLKES